MKVSVYKNKENSSNYFDLLDINHSFQIDLGKLEANYIKLQQKFHPDRFIRSSEQEKLFALQTSMNINNAYELLKNPLTRSQYLLELEGIIVNKDNATIKPEQNILLEAMEKREFLQNVESEKELYDLKQETIGSIEACVNCLSEHFSNKNFEKAAQDTIRLRYLEKYLEEIKVKKV